MSNTFQIRTSHGNLILPIQATTSQRAVDLLHAAVDYVLHTAETLPPFSQSREFIYGSLLDNDLITPYVFASEPETLSTSEEISDLYERISQTAKVSLDFMSMAGLVTSYHLLSQQIKNLAKFLALTDRFHYYMGRVQSSFYLPSGIDADLSLEEKFMDYFKQHTGLEADQLDDFLNVDKFLSKAESKEASLDRFSYVVDLIITYLNLDHGSKPAPSEPIDYIHAARETMDRVRTGHGRGRERDDDDDEDHNSRLRDRDRHYRQVARGREEPDLFDLFDLTVGLREQLTDIEHYLVDMKRSGKVRSSSPSGRTRG